MPEPVDVVQAKLAKLKQKYGSELPNKISSVEAAFAPALAGPWEEQICATAYRQIHSLAGSAGTYGFTEISEVARAAEALLKQTLETRSPLQEAQKSQVNDLVAKLREKAADAARQANS